MSNQPAAAGTQGKLHRFEGSDTIAAKIAITNAGDGLSKSLAVDPQEFRLGERVYVVLECEATQIAYKPVKDVEGAVVRVQTLRAGTATVVDKDLVDSHLEAQRVRIEQAEGVHRLSFVDVDDDDDTDEMI